MINHYRTLFLNQSDLGNPDEFISPGFQSLTLPIPLQNFYNILFPVGSTRAYQQFVEYYVENILYSSNQTQFLTSFDSRITYDINAIGDYFQSNQLLASSYLNYTTFFQNFYQNSTVIANMFAYGTQDAKSQSLWTQHFNTMYALAGLFNAYVVKVNDIYARHNS